MFLKNIVRAHPKLWKLAHKTREFLKIVSGRLAKPKEALLFVRVLPYTMVSFERLANAYELAQKVSRENLQGALVECGVWKGGAAAVMAVGAGPERALWLFDSFEGLPEPTLADGERARAYSSNRVSGRLSSIAKCVGPLEDVRRLFFRVLKLPGQNIHIEQGWFQETLPAVKERIGPIALLRMDADWYESTRCILENLFDSVVLKGYIIIDDYFCWEGCRKAVDEFFERRKLHYSLIPIDGDGVYFQKI